MRCASAEPYLAAPAQRRKGNYKFLVCHDVIYEDTGLCMEVDEEWLSIDLTGRIVVKGSHGNGFAWDGCTPKFNFFDLYLFGTPDGRHNVNTGLPVTAHASLLHDVLYQYREKCGISRYAADQLFLRYLGDFRLAGLYYRMVRLFGDMMPPPKR